MSDDKKNSGATQDPKVTKLTEALEAANAELTRLKASEQEALAENKELKDIIQELRSDNSALAATKGSSLPLVTIKGGRKVQLNHGVTYKGKRLSPQELALQPDLVEQFVEKGSTCGTLITA